MKVICPKCGEIKTYAFAETVRRYLIFDSENEPRGSTEDVAIYSGTTPRCVKCGRRIKFEEDKP